VTAIHIFLAYFHYPFILSSNILCVINTISIDLYKQNYPLFFQRLKATT